MRILEELWYGNITPNAREFVRGTEFDEACQMLCKKEEKLNALLAEKEQEIFKKYQACQSEITQISECETFISGFRLGAKIMLEVLSESESTFKSIV